jgi:wyosine [tRNA(Phe)-imidazoG37] synthetase (radical SAM superfamily)
MERPTASLDPQSAPAPASRHPASAGFGAPRHFLDRRFVYAVISQRARGLSIGVNLNPDKHCNFKCLYCEVDRDQPGLERKVNVRVMAAELNALLEMTNQGRMREFPEFKHAPEELLALKEVALSGNGEPTLCPNFGEIVHEVVHLRSQGRFPFFKLVLITNASGLDATEVREGLKVFTSQDEIWAKLDGGSQGYLNRVNRSDVSLTRLLRNILLVARERPVVIQSLFPSVEGAEPPDEEVEAYVQRLQELLADGAQISLVQVYSAHRPPHGASCGHLPLRSLSQIAQRVREATGLRAEVF